ncbi:hypothetical protein MIR68_009076 [Amoeboaphelidium protococcarum]|nr:hypothetical protein MIR68_009076 [Amoeboaphelidium protococcarum]
MDLIIIDPPVFSDGRVCYHPQELYIAEFVRRNFMTAQFIERLWKLEYSPWIQSVQNGTINAGSYVPIKIKFDVLLDRDEKSYVEYLIELSRLVQELQSGPQQDYDTQNQYSSSKCKDADNVQRILRDLPSGYLLVEEWVVEYPLPCPYYFALDRRKYLCKTGIDKPLDSSGPFALTIKLSKSLKVYGHPSGQDVNILKGGNPLSRESPDYQQVLELNNVQSKSPLKCILLDQYRSALIQYHSLISAWTADGGISTTPHLGSQSVDMVFMRGYCICINDIIAVTLNSTPRCMLVQRIEVYSELGQWKSGLFRGSLLQQQLKDDGEMMEVLNDVSCGFEHFISRSHGPLHNYSVYDQPPLDTYIDNDAVAAAQFNKFFPKLNMTTDYQNCSYQRHTNDRILEQYMEETILRVPQLLLYAPHQ